jgi:hypothetical protein
MNILIGLLSVIFIAVGGGSILLFIGTFVATIVSKIYRKIKYGISFYK